MRLLRALRTPPAFKVPLVCPPGRILNVKNERGSDLFKKTRIEVAEFIDGEYVFASDKKAKDRIKAVGATALVSTVVPVRIVFAENFDVFRAVFDLALTIVDFVVVLVIIFASSLWILGNRSRAMEILI